jgi:hypothetical protein
LINQIKIGINICCGSGKNDKKQIFSKNRAREPHVRVFQKLQNYVFIDQNQKLTNETEIGTKSFYSSGVFTKMSFQPKWQLNVRVFQITQKYFSYPQL